MPASSFNVLSWNFIYCVVADSFLRIFLRFLSWCLRLLHSGLRIWRQILRALILLASLFNRLSELILLLSQEVLPLFLLLFLDCLEFFDLLFLLLGLLSFLSFLLTLQLSQLDLHIISPVLLFLPPQLHKVYSASINVILRHLPDIRSVLNSIISVEVLVVACNFHVTEIWLLAGMRTNTVQVLGRVSVSFLRSLVCWLFLAGRELVQANLWFLCRFLLGLSSLRLLDDVILVLWPLLLRFL